MFMHVLCVRASQALFTFVENGDSSSTGGGGGGGEHAAEVTALGGAGAILDPLLAG
eukprot:COSAG06_NODE_4136_length_4535_cov_7.572813_4_plen_56_part_00